MTDLRMVRDASSAEDTRLHELQAAVARGQPDTALVLAWMDETGSMQGHVLGHTGIYMHEMTHLNGDRCAELGVGTPDEPGLWLVSDINCLRESHEPADAACLSRFGYDDESLIREIVGQTEWSEPPAGTDPILFVAAMTDGVTKTRTSIPR